MIYSKNIKLFFIVVFLMFFIVIINYFISNNDIRDFQIKKDSDVGNNFILEPQYYNKNSKSSIFIKANKATQIDKQIFLNDIYGDLKLLSNLNVTFSAGKGMANILKKTLNLDNKVFFKGQNDQTLSTKKVMINYENNKICASQGVNVVYGQAILQAEGFCFLKGKVIKFSGPIRVKIKTLDVAS